MGSRNLFSAVLASTVNYDDLISNTLNGAHSARQVALFIPCNQANGETIHLWSNTSNSAVVSHIRFAACSEAMPMCGRRLVYFAWKLTRIKLLPTRNSEPCCSIAARTRSSSKNVPLVESMSFRLM